MTRLAPYPEMPAEEVHRLSAFLEEMPLDELLGWCWEHFGARAAIGTSFQGAGLIILHRAAQMGLPFPAFTLDTGLLFPETLRLKEQIEERLGLRIENLHPELTVEQQAAEMGPALWRRRPDTCCTLRKVVPLQKKLATLDVWITGLRRQHSESRSTTQVLERYQFDALRDGIIYKLNPLATWTRPQVRAYLKEHQLPYNPLKDRGYVSIGCQPCTRPISEGEDDRAGRWTGFDKNECGIHTFLGDNI